MSDRATGEPGKAKGKPRGRHASVDDKTRARVRKLARDGMTRNAIAREVGIDGSTVTRICAAARPPITFDRSATRVAVEARTVDLKAKRTEIAERAVVEVERLFGLLDAEHEVINWHEGFMRRGTIDRPTSGDVKNYATAIGILVDKHLVLTRHDSDDRDLPAVDAWLAVTLGRTA